jgi:hypothetical protein
MLTVALTPPATPPPPTLATPTRHESEDKPGLIHSNIKGTFNVESPTYIAGIRTFIGEIKPNKWPRS